MTYQDLKKRHRKERKAYGKYLDVRVHRALSWLNRAEQCADDADSHVIFLWIAFNAAYAHEICFENYIHEKELIYNFIKRLCELDDQNRLENLVWTEFTKSIRVLLDNEYVFQPFWDHLNNKITEEEWKRQFSQAKAAAKKALSKKNTADVVSIVLSRIYTLRNQIVHGGSTWNSSVNRRQIKDCSKFMAHLVPLVIEIMMDNPDVLWGQPCYPVFS